MVIDTRLEMLKKTERSSSTIWGYPIYLIIHPFNNLIIKQVRPMRYWSRYWEQRSTQNKIPLSIEAADNPDQEDK